MMRFTHCGSRQSDACARANASASVCHPSIFTGIAAAMLFFAASLRLLGALAVSVLLSGLRIGSLDDRKYTAVPAV